MADDSDAPNHKSQTELPNPPSDTSSPIYTPYYCEENTLNLLRALQSGAYTRRRALRSYGVFVSNLDQRCLLFHQRASRQGPEYGNYVIWDYHVLVVVVLDAGDGLEEVVVLDRDSLLGGEVALRGEPLSIPNAELTTTAVPTTQSGVLNMTVSVRLYHSHLPARHRRGRRRD